MSPKGYALYMLFQNAKSKYDQNALCCRYVSADESR